MSCVGMRKISSAVCFVKAIIINVPCYSLPFDVAEMY